MHPTINQHSADSATNDVDDLPSFRNFLRMEPKATDSSLEFRTIRDLYELETLRAVWKSWPGARDSDLDVFSSMIRSRGSRCRPHVVVLVQNARPDAILIGLFERRTIPFTLGHFNICRPEVDVLEFVYGGLRGNDSEKNCAALVQEVMRSLDRGDADLALWKQLDVQSPLYSCALRLPCFAMRDYSRRPIDHWLMNFPKGLDAFFMSLERSQRSKLRRKYKKVLNCFAGKVQVRCFRSLEDLEAAIPNMEEIASKSDKRRVFRFDSLDTPQIREQLVVEAERAVVAAKEGWLRIYVLYLKERPAAYWMGTLYDRCLQADHVGYDPMWSEFSPGIFLLLYILEDLRDEDIETVDFGCKNIQFKQCFGSLRRVESTIHIHAPTLRGIQLNLLRTATHRMTDCAKFVLRRFNRLKWGRTTLQGQLAAASQTLPNRNIGNWT